MNNKIGLLILTIVLSIILASIYGIIHNQISYSISEEYFTVFKFEQFRLWENGYGDERLKASLVGGLSTWWFGLIFGIINGLIGLTQSTIKTMRKSIIGATFRIFIFAILLGLIGVLVGFFIIPKLNIDWNVPTDLFDRQSFLTAGTMHTFSYVGGIIGIIYGIKYQLKIKKASAQHSI
ncbi:hypothetical protein [Winogradskyella forsetii]|uniref:hypothetical protein n=1 Tax=Winogradskyella forsetii TaxID=2686077 RepID=UPI0015B810E3|nr:hypothetical protein [Winogradskyella forsetii]